MTTPSKKRMHLSSGASLLVGAIVLLSSIGQNHQPPFLEAASLPSVTVTGVAINNSTAKIDFIPVAGAKDYRIMDVADPNLAMTVKYAGMRHLDAGYGAHFTLQGDGVTPVFPYTTTANWRTPGITTPQTLDLPYPEIEWNALDDGQPHTLIVQALDQLGPVPPHNLTAFNNALLSPDPMSMPGANDGWTADGFDSINGQGSATNTPHVIAQSAPFVVKANSSLRPLSPGAFLDTFPTSEANTLQQVGASDLRLGAITYTLNVGGTTPWGIQVRGADINNTGVMIDHGHFMDRLFDGLTTTSPGITSTNYHIGWSTTALSPQPTADLSGGKMLHMTEEVDGMLDVNRWLSWQLAPATDPITNFRADDGPFSAFTNNSSMAVNSTDKALWVQTIGQTCDAMLFRGPISLTDTAPITDQLVPLTSTDMTAPPCYNTLHLGGDGTGLDNRNRFDLFVTQQHLALFEDGTLLMQTPITGGLPFSQAKLYFTHDMYNTNPRVGGSEPNRIATVEPWFTYWGQYFQHSDERHWDNMGFEVLPASAVPTSGDFSALSSMIYMPMFTTPVPPTIASATPTTPPATATATSTAVPSTATPTATSTTVPSTPTASPSFTTVPTSLPSVTATATTVPRKTLVISRLRLSRPQHHVMLVRWTTNLPATGQISYHATYPHSIVYYRPVSTTLSTLHMMRITGVTAPNYVVRVKSTTPSGMVTTAYTQLIPLQSVVKGLRAGGGFRCTALKQKHGHTVDHARHGTHGARSCALHRSMPSRHK